MNSITHNTLRLFGFLFENVPQFPMNYRDRYFSMLFKSQQIHKSAPLTNGDCFEKLSGYSVI